MRRTTERTFLLGYLQNTKYENVNEPQKKNIYIYINWKWMKKIEPEKWKTKAKQVESAAKDQEDKSARILELLFIYIWISGSVGTLRRTPSSSCSVLFLVLFPAFAPYCFVCLFACLPQFRPQKLLARGKLRGEQPGSGGKLSWVRWHFCILPIRSVAAGRKVCTAPFALLKTTKKWK